MSTAVAPAPGTLLPGTGAYAHGMHILTDPAEVPADRTLIPDEAVIGIEVWAALRGVKLGTVQRARGRAALRRKEGHARPWDMPPEDGKLGQSPYWLMSTYRAWEAAWTAAPPGFGEPGRPRSGRARRIRTARLPITCPECGHTITEAEVRAGRVQTGEASPAAPPAV